MGSRTLTTIPIENHSGFSIKNCHLEILKRKHYFKIEESVGGDAPKDVLKIYIYNESKMSNPKNWAKYISKYGHKWYPMESVTEYLIYRLGEIIGLNMAKSRLLLIQGQLRFCSKNFLNKDEVLIHGAEILSRYLHEQSTSFIDEIEKERLTKELIGVDDVVEAIASIYKENSEEYLMQYFCILFFDALLGINDRHFYNWGVIDTIKTDEISVRFAPIFDSARGLLWNFSEERLNSKCNNNSFIDKYIIQSEPKIGLSGKRVNHFQMVKHINDYYKIPKTIRNLFLKDSLSQDFENCIYVEFKFLLSDIRKDLIFRILQQRIKNFGETIAL